MSAPKTPDEIVKRIISRSLLARVGSEVVAIIRERTLKGEFLEGSSPGADRYSTTPLPLPLGGLAKRAQSCVWRMLKAGDEDVQAFTNVKSKRAWVILKGGYKQYRELAGLQTSVVNMSWSGRMMRNLSVVNISEDTVAVGFTSPEEAQKALWHNKLGAGKSHRKHIFLGLSQDELARVAKIVSDFVMMGESTQEGPVREWPGLKR
jgi:hypothetical protein